MDAPSQILYDKYRHRRIQLKKEKTSQKSKSVPQNPVRSNKSSFDHPDQQKQEDATLIQNMKKNDPDQQEKPASQQDPLHKPTNRPLIETADGQIRKKYTPEETALSQVQIDKEKQKEMFEELVKDSRQVLYKISTIFPFDLFPDTLVIDLNRIHVVTREFFLFRTQANHRHFCIERCVCRFRGIFCNIKIECWIWPGRHITFQICT